MPAEAKVRETLLKNVKKEVSKQKSNQMILFS